MADDFRGPDYSSGYYLMDPVYASAVRTARALGYELVAYEVHERGPADDPSFRDRRQAEHIKERILDRDPDARVLIIAGRRRVPCVLHRVLALALGQRSQLRRDAKQFCSALETSHSALA